MKLCTVKSYDTYYKDRLFENTIESIADANKNFKPLNLDKYIEYGYMSHEGEIVAMCGITDFGYGCLRVESGCWINPKYRTNYFRGDNKYNHYMLSESQMSNHDANVWFKSRRAKNPAGIARVIPNGWDIYPDMIELCWKDNWQWVVYKGEIHEYLEKLQAPNINTYRTRKSILVIPE